MSLFFPSSQIPQLNIRLGHDQFLPQPLDFSLFTANEICKILSSVIRHFCYISVPLLSFTHVSSVSHLNKTLFLRHTIFIRLLHPRHSPVFQNVVYSPACFLISLYYFPATKSPFSFYSPPLPFVYSVTPNVIFFCQYQFKPSQPAVTYLCRLYFVCSAIVSVCTCYINQLPCFRIICTLH